MSYLNYVILGHFAIIVASLIYTLYGSAFLLLKKPQNKFKISRTPVVFLYFCFTASSSTLLLIYSGYTVAWWRSDETTYNPNILYFIAGIPTIYVNLIPVADFYLCIDRCLAFAFPLIYQTRLKFLLSIIFISTDMLILLTYFIVTNYFSFFTPDTTTTCVYYICLVWKLNYPLIMTYTKYLFCGLNFVTSLILLLLIFLKKSVHLSNKLNKPVILISAINILFTFIPGVFADQFKNIIGRHLADYVGDTNLTFVCVSIAVSVHLYLRVYKKMF